MPIIIDDKLNKANDSALKKSAEILAKKKLSDPKFFTKDLTGSGKSTGVLSVALNPVNYGSSTSGYVSPNWITKIKVNTFTQVTNTPVSPYGAFDRIDLQIAPDTHFIKISDEINEAYYAVNIEPQSVYIMDYNGPKQSCIIPGTGAAPVKEHKVNFRCELLYFNKSENTFTVKDTQFCFNPTTDFKPVIESHIAGNMHIFDEKRFDAYIKNYNTYDEMCRLSYMFQTDIANIIMTTYDTCDKCSRTYPMRAMLRYINNYKISLDQYKILYDELTKRFTEKDMTSFTRINTSLLLHQTVRALAQTQFEPLPAVQSAMPLNFYSNEQRKAITSTEPLNIIQAGAGTGKSTTVNARLQYLKSLGVKMSDVMVLSFTNAAADHILDICPDVQSMTIARMLDSIYKTAHPTHQLSSSDIKSAEGATFQNSLELYKKTNPIAAELIDASNLNAKKNDFSYLLSLCENHHDEVMELLDKINQTTFAIELVICYLDYKTLTIPFSIKHLIIDEVQDNSEFEFIFFLNMTSILKNHLYLVGDSSQTLFEFRASNPKAINAIEASGIFRTLPLSTNYRSNQCILNFANILLQSIEANAVAQLQLQAFSLQPICQQDFMNHVTCDYNKLDKSSDYKTLFDTKFRMDIKDYIDSKLKAGEQVCILSHYGRDVRYIENLCHTIWPNNSVVNISPEKHWSFGYFSNYIKKNASSLQHLPTQHIDALFTRLETEIINATTKSGKLNPTASNYQVILNKLRQYLYEWKAKNYNVIALELINFQTGKITLHKLCDIIGQSLIDFEIEKNGLAQTLASAKNAQKKVDTKNAEILLCTIHSAKGLEFDNTVIIYKNDNQMSQEDMRMYYVALTRAKKSEYILAFGNVTSSLIDRYYNTALISLPKVIQAVNTSVVSAPPVSPVANNEDIQKVEKNAEISEDTDCEEECNTPATPTLPAGMIIIPNPEITKQPEAK